MQIHQTGNSVGTSIYNAYSYCNFGWGKHIHKCYELVMVKSGTLKATINGKEIVLAASSALLVAPYFLHSYEPSEDCVYHIAVFSANHAQAFDNKMKNSQADDYSFFFLPAQWTFLEQTLFPHSATKDSRVVKQPNPDFFAIKSCIYMMASRFCSTRKLSPKNKDYSMLVRIVEYVEENFTQDISLASLAHNLGYDYEYVSRIFNRVFNLNLKTLINMYRCEHAENLIVNTDLPLTLVAMNSGFQSIRSFNRVFKEITGKSPSALRK